MQDLTILVDDDVLAAVEAVASQRDTTVAQLVSDYLTGLSEESRTVEARKALLALMDSTTGRLDAAYEWDREDAYAERFERVLSRHQRPGLRSPS